MKKIFAPVLLFGLLFLGCSGIKVTADYDGTVDFTQFKTYEYYGWAEESDKILNDLDRQRIEKAFGEEFEANHIDTLEDLPPSPEEIS